jgi:hypothetical protein
MIWGHIRLGYVGVSYPNQPSGPPPYPAPVAAVPKKSNAWKWILGILGGLVLLCGGGFVACTALVGKGINDAVETEQAENDARAAENMKSCEGKSYPDQQPENDRCADAAGAVTLDDVKVTATPLERRQGECAPTFHTPTIAKKPLASTSLTGSCSFRLAKLRTHSIVQAIPTR